MYKQNVKRRISIKLLDDNQLVATKNLSLISAADFFKFPINIKVRCNFSTPHSIKLFIKFVNDLVFYLTM